MNETRDWGKNRFPRLFSYCGCVFTTFSSVSFKMPVSLVRDYWTKQISGIFSPFRYRKLAFCRVRPTKHGIKWQWGTGIADCRLDNWNRGHLIMFSGRTMRVNPIITRHNGTKVSSALLVRHRGHGARLDSTNKSTHEIIAQRSAVALHNWRKLYAVCSTDCWLAETLCNFFFFLGKPRSVRSGSFSTASYY